MGNGHCRGPRLQWALDEVDKSVTQLDSSSHCQDRSQITTLTNLVLDLLPGPASCVSGALLVLAVRSDILSHDRQPGLREKAGIVSAREGICEIASLKASLASLTPSKISKFEALNTHPITPMLDLKRPSVRFGSSNIR